MAGRSRFDWRSTEEEWNPIANGSHHFVCSTHFGCSACVDWFLVFSRSIQSGLIPIILKTLPSGDWISLLVVFSSSEWNLCRKISLVCILAASGSVLSALQVAKGVLTWIAHQSLYPVPRFLIPPLLKIMLTFWAYSTWASFRATGYFNHILNCGVFLLYLACPVLLFYELHDIWFFVFVHRTIFYSSPVVVDSSPILQNRKKNIVSWTWVYLGFSIVFCHYLNNSPKMHFKCFSSCALHQASWLDVFFSWMDE